MTDKPTPQLEPKTMNIAEAIVLRESLAEAVAIAAFWKNRALVCAQLLHDLQASLDPRIKAAIESAETQKAH